MDTEFIVSFVMLSMLLAAYGVVAFLEGRKQRKKHQRIEAELKAIEEGKFAIEESFVKQADKQAVVPVAPKETLYIHPRFELSTSSEVQPMLTTMSTTRGLHYLTYTSSCFNVNSMEDLKEFRKRLLPPEGRLVK